MIPSWRRAREVDVADVSDPVTGIIGWLHDWASWILATLGAITTSIAALWRRSIDLTKHETEITRMHQENRAALADLAARLRALEEKDRSTVIRLTELATLAPSLDRIEETVIRLEMRINEIAARPVGRR